MGWAAGSDSPHCCFVGIHLEPSDELLQIIRRYSLVCDEQQRSIRKQQEGFEILHDIVLERIDSAVRDVSIPYSDDQGVSIGACLDNRIDCRDAARLMLDSALWKTHKCTHC